ncbi:MAG TPA: hypothetical protein VF043_09260 [Ktedonobacteraceae bacterium]
MTDFNVSGEQISIRDEYGDRAVLNPLEALDLLQWLSDRRDVFLSLAQKAANQGRSTEKELEIRLYQENLSYLDELKAIIPSLHEYRPPAKVLSVRLEEVTERALELLNELQLEYRIHPLLEDNDVFAQG